MNNDEDLIDEPVSEAADSEWMEESAQKLIQTNDVPNTDFEAQHQLFNPVAKDVHSDINRDMALANLTSAELAFIHVASNNLGSMKYIRSKFNLGSTELENLFRRSRDIIQVSSLSRDGFLRHNLNTQRQEFSLTRKMNAPNKKKKFSLKNYS